MGLIRSNNVIYVKEYVCMKNIISFVYAISIVVVPLRAMEQDESPIERVGRLCGDLMYYRTGQTSPTPVKVDVSIKKNQLSVKFEKDVLNNVRENDLEGSSSKIVDLNEIFDGLSQLEVTLSGIVVSGDPTDKEYCEAVVKSLARLYGLASQTRVDDATDKNVGN